MAPQKDSINGLNFAPVEPLKDAVEIMRGRRSNGSSLSAYFRECAEEIELADEVPYRQNIEMAQVISNMRSGKLVMKEDLTGSGYVFLPRIGEEQDRSNYPVFGSTSEVLKAKWQKARPMVRARANGDGYRTKIQMNNLDLCISTYFKDIFNKRYELDEAGETQDFGTYITRFFYNDRLNQLQWIAPVLQDISKVVMPGYAACLQCGKEGEPENFTHKGEIKPRCPDCGSYQTTKMVDPKSVNQQQISDIEVISQGDVDGMLCSFAASKYDLRKFAHDSSYFRFDQWIPLRLIRNIFGENANIDGDVEADHVGFRVMEALATRGGSIENLGENSFYGNPDSLNERARYTELWLTPEWYQGFRLSAPEQTLAGTIPADVPLEQIFPEGVCLQGFNQMKLITGIHAEESNVVSGVYLLQSFSGVGKGLGDGVDIAKDLNEVHSMAMAGLKRFGASGVFYDKSTLSIGDVRKLFQPNKAVPIDLKKNPHITQISQAIGQISTNPVNQVLPQYAIQLQNLLSMATMTGDFAQGMTQDVDINTLGGQKLAHAKNEEQKGAILTMKAYHREQSAEKIAKLLRKHMKFEKFFAHDEKQGRTKGKYISGANLPEVIKFDAVPDSEIPTNAFEKQESAKDLVEHAGGLGNLIQMANIDPRMTGWYADQFGAKLPLLDEEELQLVCLARMDDILEFSEVFATPEEVLMNLRKPLAMREYGHMLKAQFLSEILDDDEVAMWSPLARVSIQKLIEAHYDAVDAGGYTDASRQQGYAMKLQAEGMQQQYAMNQPYVEADRAQAQDQADEQTQQGMVQEVGRRVLDDEQKAVDDERADVRDNKAHERNLQLEEMKQKSAGGAQKSAQKKQEKKK